MNKDPFNALEFQVEFQNWKYIKNNFRNFFDFSKFGFQKFWAYKSLNFNIRQIFYKAIRNLFDFEYNFGNEEIPRHFYFHFVGMQIYILW